MAEIKVIFGSTTGITENIALTIAEAFGTVAVNVASAKAEDFEGDLLILGSSTWGIGELQDDWVGGITMLENANLTGKQIAIFGTGDQEGFADTFCDAMGLIAGTVESKGAVLIGKTPVDGYTFSGSAAVKDGEFCGLALDENNQPEQTSSRLSAWIDQLKKEVKA